MVVSFTVWLIVWVKKKGGINTILCIFIIHVFHQTVNPLVGQTQINVKFEGYLYTPIYLEGGSVVCTVGTSVHGPHCAALWSYSWEWIELFLANFLMFLC